MKRIMRILLLILVCGALATVAVPARAEQQLTFGFVTGAQALVYDEVQAQAFVGQLASRVPFPVHLRLFNGEIQLHQWMHNFREVDCAWFGDEFFRRLPPGEVLPLASAQNVAESSPTGFLVARQGLDAALLVPLHAALLSMNNIPSQEGKVARVSPVPAASAVAPPADAAAMVPSPAPATSPLIAVPPPAAVAAQAIPVSLAADRLDYTQDVGVFQAAGDVNLRQGEMTLTADELLWQETTRDVVATGNVRLVETAGELQGSSIHTNLGNGLGVIKDGRGFIKERNFYLEGEQVERLGEDSYRIVDGSFTTCDGDPPDWQFTASQVDVDLGRYARARDVWFEVRDQPVLYLPYLLFPVKSERESGFLMPRFGYSSRKGALLSLAWYEVIDRHLDATVYVDYLSRIGLGKGLEYRYALDGGGGGRAYAYHISGMDDTPDSYALDWQHEGVLPGNVRLAAAVEYVNKREFFEDFGEAADEYNRDQTVSTILVQHHRDKLNLTGYLRYIKDLEFDNDATLQRLPEAGLDVPFLRLGEYPLYTRTELRGTNFWREEGDEGQRLYLRQGLGMVLKPGSWLEFSPEIAAYGRYYHADSGSESDLLPEFAATLSTRLVRVYPFARWGIDSLQHSIEPQVSYTYIPNRDQEDLPLFDLKDRIGPLNLVSYALVNRLTARSLGADGSRSYREVLNLRLSQAYDVRVERDDALEDSEPFSDLRTELMLRPTPGSALDIDALIRVNDGTGFKRLNAGVSYSDERGNSARLGYSYRNTDNGFSPTDYLSVEVGSALLSPVYVNVEERFDFLDQGSLETVLGLEYRARCWSLFLTFRDRPDEEEFLVGVALSGVGRIGNFGSSLQPLER